MDKRDSLVFDEYFIISKALTGRKNLKDNNATK